jgi:hypothetical protein
MKRPVLRSKLPKVKAVPAAGRLVIATVSGDAAVSSTPQAHCSNRPVGRSRPARDFSPRGAIRCHGIRERTSHRGQPQ